MKTNEQSGGGARTQGGRLAGFGRALPLAAALALGAGCKREDIRTYQVPKEAPFQVAAAPMSPRQGAERGGFNPHVHYGELPEGWRALPADGMRVASFQIPGEEGRSASLVVIPLPLATPDLEMESVNIWRRELQLEELEAAELATQAERVPVGDLSGNLYDIMGPGEEPAKTNIVGVVIPGQEATWFLKMSGAPSVVARAKEPFLRFIQTFEFHTGSHGPAQTAATGAGYDSGRAAGGTPQWRPPENWREKSPGSMVTAAFSVSGKENRQAEVTISRLSGDGGGLLANINRWRGQLMLEPIGPADLSRHVAYIEVGEDKVPLVDFTGTDPRAGERARMITVAVRQGGETWFYKIMGDEQVIAEEKDSFVNFIQSAY